MKKCYYYLIAPLLVLVILAGCTPSPAPIPAAPLTPTPVTAPTSNISPPTSQDAAWDKVIAAAKKEGVVTIYSTYFVADTSRRLSKDFQDKYGIRVEILAGGGRTSLEKIKVEAQIKKPIADLMESSGGSATELVLSGMAVSVGKDLPALKDKNAFVVEPIYSPGGELIQHNLYVNAPVINTRLVKEQDEPKSYQNLLEPKWKGNILIPDPAATGSTAPFYGPLFYKSLDLDYWRRLSRQDVKIWAGSVVEGTRMVARGEYNLFLTGTTDATGPLIAEGAPVKLLAMEEGNPAGGFVIAAVKDSPHPNAAKLFIDWLQTKEGQISYAEPSRATPIRKDVPDFSMPGTQLKLKKIWNRTWEFEEWANKEMKLGTVAQAFGVK